MFANYFQGMAESKYQDPFPELYYFVCIVYILYGLKKQTMAIKFVEPFPKQALVFTCLQSKSFENTLGKGEIARNEQISHFPAVFCYPFEELSAIFIKFKIAICKLFQFDRV